MYKIKFQVKSGIYSFESKSGTYAEGSLIQLTKLALDMGFCQDELAVAFATMAEKKSTVAEFGINKRFTCCYDDRKIA